MFLKAHFIPCVLFPYLISHQQNPEKKKSTKAEVGLNGGLKEEIEQTKPKNLGSRSGESL